MGALMGNMKLRASPDSVHGRAQSALAAYGDQRVQNRSENPCQLGAVHTGTIPPSRFWPAMSVVDAVDGFPTGI